MGLFASGFAQAMGDHFRQRADEEHTFQQNEKQRQAQDLRNAIIARIDPLTGAPASPEQLEYWQNQHDKLMPTSPAMKDTLKSGWNSLAIAMRHPQWEVGAKPQDQNSGTTPNNSAPAGPSSSATPGLPPPPVNSSQTSPTEQINPTSANDGPKPPDDDSAAADAASSPTIAPPGPEAALSPSAGAPAISTNLTGAGNDTLHASLAKPGMIAPPPLPPQPAPLPPSNGPSALPPPPGQVPDSSGDASVTPVAATSPTTAAGNSSVKLKPWTTALMAANPTYAQQQARQISLYQAQHDILHRDKLEEVTAEAAARGLNSKPVFGPATSVLQARQLGQMGKEFLDQNGEPINLATIPDGMSLKYMAQGSRHWYEPMSPNQRVVNVGGRVYAVNPADIADMTQGAGKELGTARPGSTSFHTDPATGATLESGNTPNAPGMQGRGAASSAVTPSTAPGMAPPPGIVHDAPSRAVSGGVAPTSSRGIPPKGAPSLDDNGLIPTTARATPQVREAANSILQGQDPATIKPERLAQSAKELAANYGYKYQPPLTAPAQKIVFTTQPVLEQVNRQIKAIEDLNLQKNNTSGYLAFDRLGYSLGHAPEEGTLGRQIASLSMGSVLDAASIMQGSSRAYPALKLAMEHTPNVHVDSPKLLYDKLLEIRQRLQDTVSDAQKYGVKGGGGGVSSATPGLPAPPGNAQSALPPEARSALKEGHNTRFNNGQIWTLKDGVPQQVNNAK